MQKNTSCFPAPPPARVELSNNPVKLCNEISRLFRGKMRQNHGTEGVMTQPGAHLVLSFLAIGDGTTQLELVRSTHLKAPSISTILKKMEEEGIVTRKIDENDARAIRVYLTEYGKELDLKHIKSIKALDALALDGIDEDEQATLMKLLTKIRNNLMDMGQREENNK